MTATQFNIVRSLKVLFLSGLIVALTVVGDDAIAGKPWFSTMLPLVFYVFALLALLGLIAQLYTWREDAENTQATRFNEWMKSHRKSETVDTTPTTLVRGSGPMSRSQCK